MRIVGVDLAAQPRNTAGCVVEWTAHSAKVTDVGMGWTDEQILRAIRAADKVGIDCPFGWPDDFVEAVSAHSRHAPWPGRDVSASGVDAFRRSLRYRATDEFVKDRSGVTPLSVSTDRIGITTMRCASILDRLAVVGVPIDRGGGGKVVEVYPAAALASWGLPHKGYKRAWGLANLKSLAKELLDQLPELTMSEEHRLRCETSDDCLDALLSALVARAATLGLTLPPETDQHKERAVSEGWIHIPRAGSLTQLVADLSSPT